MRTSRPITAASVPKRRAQAACDSITGAPVSAPSTPPLSATNPSAASSLRNVRPSSGDTPSVSKNFGSTHAIVVI